MSPRRTRRGTIRADVNEVSVNESLKSASKSNRRTRRAIQSTKNSDEENSHVEVNSLINNVTATSFLNDTSVITRRRKKKDPEISIFQDVSVSMSIDESKSDLPAKKKNPKTPKATKKTKRNTSKKVDSYSLISEDESFNKKVHKDEKHVSYSLISEDEEKPVSPSRRRVRLNNENVSKKTNEPDKNTKTSEGIVTPKSSPLNVSFTPHRTTKTPRDSPENLGSPKSHSHYTLKSMNVPRKLEIENSPPSSENSCDTLHQKTLSNKKSTSFNKKISPKFSKSPKIVLKSPKKKSSKKSSPLKKSKSPAKSKKSPKTVPPSKSQKLEKSESFLTVDESVQNSSLQSKQSPVKSPQKSENVSYILSPVKSANLSVKLDNSLKKNSSLQVESLSDEKNVLDLNLSGSKNILSKSPKTMMPGSSKKSPKKTITPGSSKKSPKKTITPGSSKKSPKKTITPGSSKKSSKSNTLISLTKSPKDTSPTISRKMPKIVLQLKSKKSPLKSSRMSTPLKSKKIGLSTPVKSTKSIQQHSSSKLPKSTDEKSQNEFQTSVDPSKNSTLSPRVVMSKIVSPKDASFTIEQNQPSINLVPVDRTSVKLNPKTSISVGKISKSPKSISKKQVMSSVTSVKTQNNTLKRLNTSSVNTKNKTPISGLKRKLSSLLPNNTSTPRDKTKLRLTAALDAKNISLKKLNTSVKQSNQPVNSKVIKKLNSQSEADSSIAFLEDVTEPSLNNSSLIHLSDVFDSDTSQKNNTFEISCNDLNTPTNKKSPNNLKNKKSPRNANVSKVKKSPKNTSSFKTKKSPRDTSVFQTGKKDGTFELEKDHSNLDAKDKSVKNSTYELEHPKTPGLQKMTKKRTVDEAEFDANDEQGRKRNCRVHFESPALRKQSSGISRIGTPGHAIQQKPTPTTQIKNSLNFSLNNREIKSSASAIGMKTPLKTPLNKRQSHSSSNASRKSIQDAQLASVNRLSKPKVILDSGKKLGVKPPSARKIPNFAEIHQKNFAKMESIVDLKKRVEKRHVLKTTTSSAKKINNKDQNQPAPPDANGAYSRFGFKLRKNDAVSMVSKKQTNTVESREKKREDARSALKGVRMNRRFELQMKSRTKTT